MIDSPYTVDILMCVYNHEEFIAQAIEGVVSQQTNFKYRLIIGEDCSTDNTKRIVEKYLDLYSEKMLVFFHKTNIGAYENSRILFRESSSKYIALCDGDDYWTDPLKLQKQVDFLEANPEYVLCAANATVNNLTNKFFRSIYCNFNRDRSFDQKQVLMEFYCPTLSMLFRNHLHNIPEWFHEVKSGDTFLHLILSQYGKFYYMDFIAGVYRQHNAGISNMNSQTEWFDNNITHLRKFKKIINEYNVQSLDEVIYRSQLEYINALIKEKQYKRALGYFRELQPIPFHIRKRYFRQVINLYIRTLLRIKNRPIPKFQHVI